MVTDHLTAPHVSSAVLYCLKRLSRLAILLLKVMENMSLSGYLGEWGLPFQEDPRRLEI